MNRKTKLERKTTETSISLELDLDGQGEYEIDTSVPFMDHMLTLFAVQLGRRQDGLNTLALVAALMALFNPYILWDVGFQLSFAATLGLLLYAGPLSQSFVRFTSRYTS